LTVSDEAFFVNIEVATFKRDAFFLSVEALSLSVKALRVSDEAFQVIRQTKSRIDAAFCLKQLLFDQFFLPVSREKEPEGASGRGS
jgi:hypothetical protein